MRCVIVSCRLLLVVAFAFLTVSPALANAPPVRPALLVVDLQQHFIADARFNPATETALEASEEIVRAAGRASIPVYVTYESGNSGDHAMPANVRDALPAGHRTFFKTKYAASELRPLIDQLERSDITHVVMIGAETDVCVLLTALGLRQLGYHVTVVQEALISPERNVEPALERLREAGVQVADQRDAVKLMSGKVSAVAAGDVTPRKLAIKPFKDGKVNVAVVLNRADVALPADGCGVAARRARLEQLTLLAEWLRFPVYVNDAVETASEQLSSEPGPVAIGGGRVRPISELDARQYGFIVLAGHEAGMRSMLAQVGRPRRLFVVTDAILPDTARGEQSDALHGFVPLTYKTFYREVLGSVSMDDWPAQAWSDGLRSVAAKVRDPEALPTVPDCTPQIGDSLEHQVR